MQKGIYLVNANDLASFVKLISPSFVVMINFCKAIYLDISLKSKGKMCKVSDGHQSSVYGRDGYSK